jgi:hypothetical protein
VTGGFFNPGESSMGRLTDRCTGAAYGIGFAAAERLAMEGARVVIADIRGHDAAAEKLSAKGLDAVAATTDVTDVDSVSALIRDVMARHGCIDILVNNAAISAELRPAPFEQSSPEEWRRIYEVNVIGVFNMCKAVSPHMRAAKTGRIINVSSGTAFKGTPGMLHYIARKQGSDHFDDALACQRIQRRPDHGQRGVPRLHSHGERAGGIRPAADLLRSGDQNTAPETAWDGRRCRQRDLFPRERRFRLRDGAIDRGRWGLGLPLKRDEI